MILYSNSATSKFDFYGNPAEIYGYEQKTIKFWPFKFILCYEHYKVKTPYGNEGSLVKSIYANEYHGKHCAEINMTWFWR